MATKTNIEVPELHNEDINNMFEYISSVDFLDLLTESSKVFLMNEKTKNKKDEIIGYWMAIQLRYLIKKYFPTEKLTVQFKPKINGLLNNTIYELAIDYDGKTIIVMNIKFVISNLATNFQRNFDDVVINTVNVNNYKGIEYVNLMLLSEETPAFTFWQEKRFEKYEQLHIKHLIKLTNLSLLKTNQCYLPTIILNKNVLVSDAQLKSSVKQQKVKYVDQKRLSDMCIKFWYNDLIYQRIKDTIIEDDIYTVLKKILLLVKARLPS